MRHFMFALAAATFGATAAAGAQATPARDLLDFPIAMMAEPGALAAALGGGLWNPAAVTLGRDRLRGGAAVLTSPIDLGVTATTVAAEARVRGTWYAGVTLVHASVSDLIRTDTDPQSLGEEIAYRTTLASAAAARRWGPLGMGVAARLRTAQVLEQYGRSVSADAGVLLDHPRRLPIRVALSTFLLGGSRSERGAVLAAVDARIGGRDSVWQSRAGVSSSLAGGGAREDFVFGALQVRGLSARGGVVQHTRYGETTARLRLALGLQYARYVIGLAREDAGPGLGGSYQFMLTRGVR